MEEEQVTHVSDSSTDSIGKEEIRTLNNINEIEKIFRTLYLGWLITSKAFQHLVLQREFNQQAAISCFTHLLGYEIFVQVYSQPTRSHIRKKIHKLLASCSWEEDRKIQDALYDAGLFPNDFR